MGSLKYEIAQLSRNCDSKKSTGTPIADQTLKEYKNDAIHFGMWCKSHYGVRHAEDCIPLIQSYADSLLAAGKAPSTIHKYLAGVCHVFGTNLAAVKKPPRIVGNNTRSRGVKAVDKRADAQREASPRLYDFAVCVGIRRAEYARLRGCDFGEDAVGFYVLVRRGKGGKVQKQRVLPEHTAFVRSYFDGSENYIFSKAEMRNKIDLHHLRALQGQKTYQHYADCCAADPAYRDRLLTDIKWLWDEDDKTRAAKGMKPKRWNAKLYTGKYYLRGQTRSLALAQGMPTGYDRLCVLAVSILHLAHWRLDVTVDNYLLAR